ncbi:hypothetical protein [Adlercreutzia sp. ZJ138]|uniref:hypothetical protein n=1 Tax=Adlercreutzia sp. ZJ138 TaxID=2709405 RepID=UPI0013EBCF5B|nr:hypothetical protein [Adlercreutzia sp. ZJ138]
MSTSQRKLLDVVEVRNDRRYDLPRDRAQLGAGRYTYIDRVRGAVPVDDYSFCGDAILLGTSYDVKNDHGGFNARAISGKILVSEDYFLIVPRDLSNLSYITWALRFLEAEGYLLFNPVIDLIDESTLEEIELPWPSETVRTAFCEASVGLERLTELIEGKIALLFELGDALFSEMTSGGVLTTTTLGEAASLRYGEPIGVVESNIVAGYPFFTASDAVGKVDGYCVEGPALIVRKKGRNLEFGWTNAPSWLLPQLAAVLPGGSLGPATLFFALRHGSVGARRDWFVLEEGCPTRLLEEAAVTVPDFATAKAFERIGQDVLAEVSLLKRHRDRLALLYAPLLKIVAAD